MCIRWQPGTNIVQSTKLVQIRTYAYRSTNMVQIISTKLVQTTYEIARTKIGQNQLKYKIGTNCMRLARIRTYTYKSTNMVQIVSTKLVQTTYELGGTKIGQSTYKCGTKF